ncbi:unnamed protein product [Spodoptera exigua]|nr:unnamed protein product [Spodoptera exigua]
MEETCCAPMEGYIETHNECMRTHSTFEFTCYVSRCVTAKLRYRKTNVIDPEMVKSAFWKYNLFSPETKPLTDEITKNCLDDKYFDYVTSETYCDYNKFELCANVNALMGCQEFYSTPSCEALAENVAICKPVLQDYLDYLNGSGSC